MIGWSRFWRRSPPARWQFASATDIGGRSEQQDRLLVNADPAGGSQLLVVADGMGGHNDGALAAEMVIRAAAAGLGAGPLQDPLVQMREMLIGVHRHIAALQPDAPHAPGSTCVMLYLEGCSAYWAHVGDSRLYHLREGRSIFVTCDHRAVDSSDPGGNQGLYMCLGGRNPLQPETTACEVMPGDLFYLCSDGFWQATPPEQVAAALTGSGDLQEATSRLVAETSRRNGAAGDNISLVVARYQA